MTCPRCDYHISLRDTALRAVTWLTLYFVAGILVLGYIHERTAEQLRECRRVTDDR